MALARRIQEFLQRLSPLTRRCLLSELERLETSEGGVPGSTEILATLRAEFRKDGSAQIRANNPSRYFFAPLEPLLVDGAPEHANLGRICRGSLPAIWEWTCRDLLPTMARDYIKDIDELSLANKQRELREVAAAFQTKVVKYLTNTLGSADAVSQTRIKLATYTTSQAAYGDLTKTLAVLRERDALAKFNAALPAEIKKFDEARIAKVTALLDGFREKHADVLPFALALVAKRLTTSWQLIALATKAAPSKNAADVAATPYAMTVSMVLDRLEDKASALRIALRNNRVLVAKEILTGIYDTEHALRTQIGQLEPSDWGIRLDSLMQAIAVLVKTEVARFPDTVGHVLGSRSLRRHETVAGRLTDLASKGRDALSSGASYCKRIMGQSESLRA